MVPRSLSGLSATSEQVSPAFVLDSQPHLAFQPSQPTRSQLQDPRSSSWDRSPHKHVEATTKVRDRLWKEFETWLVATGTGLELFEPEGISDIDGINATMSNYGRELFTTTGRPYGHFF